jgi:hypothetical protein
MQSFFEKDLFGFNDDLKIIRISIVKWLAYISVKLLSTKFYAYSKCNTISHLRTRLSFKFLFIFTYEGNRR